MLDESIMYGRIYRLKRERVGEYEGYSFDLDTARVYNGEKKLFTQHCRTFKKMESLKLQTGQYIFVRGVKRKDGDNWIFNASDVEVFYSVPDR